MPLYPGLLNHWFIACRSSQLRRRPLARTLLGQPLALFRAGSGQAAALVDRCPHRNVPLSQGRVTGECLACPYHGWEFDGQGLCRAVPGLVEGAPSGQAEDTDQPQARNAIAVPTAEQDGFVWIYHGAGAPASAPAGVPASPPPRFAHLGETGYAAFSGEATLQAALPDALENFLDGTHTHFVHTGLIRSAAARKPVTAIVRRGVASVEAEYPDEGQQSGLISRLFGAGVDDVFGRFCLPSTAQLEYRARGQLKLLISLCFTPINEGRQRLFAVAVGPAPALVVALAGPLLRLFFLQALRQDQRILRLQAANLRRFGEPRYAYTPLDLLGPHILRLLKHGPAPRAEDWPEQRVTLRL
jgi:phenylpropionate dioxygenase-like ring-hydroxylating dioxygenase large terminal subunit